MSSREYGSVEGGAESQSPERPEGYVDWSYDGKTDIAVGTAATAAERLITFGAALVSIVILLCLRLIFHYEWTWWQTLIALLIVYDTIGGTVGLATNSNKRFYFTPTKPEESAHVHFLKDHIKFSAIHVHPLLVWLVFLPHSWVFGILWYLYIQIAVAIVVRCTPLYLRRPVAFCFVALAVFINSYIIRPVLGFEWLGPLLTLKLAYGHCVQEEPYRPSPM